ncbi:MAG TPA: ABC transporter permease, partial [Blastocatellia bacterium]|nr:ABC transporter permease [Blastocatellia bacterium]
MSARVRVLVSRIRGWLRPNNGEEEIASELDVHLDLLRQQNIRRGLAPDEALRAARLRLGGMAQLRETNRELRGLPMLETFFQDLRYALRSLRKNPGFTLLCVATLALGIGATTAIFSVVYGVLLRPLPYHDSDRIMAVFEVTTKGRPMRVADPNFDDFRDQNHTFQSIAKYIWGVSSVSAASAPTRTMAAAVSPEFLKVFGVQPILGRDFSPADAKQGAGPTVLVSYGYWKQFLGSSRDLSQSRLKIDGAVFSVIGVLPAGFQFPTDVDLWLPADLDGENPSRTSHNYYAVGRLRDGATAKQADSDISVIARRIHDGSSEQGAYLLKDGT